MITRQRAAASRPPILFLIALCSLFPTAHASLGDRLPDFRECLSVCVDENCGRGTSVVPLHLRLLLWTCPANCDYVCQRIVTRRRVERDPPMLEPVLQFHGNWPFYRVGGVQEPFSVLFPLGNFLAHRYGLSMVREQIPAAYPLREYHVGFGYFGLASWVCSMAFHTRDFGVTEKLDYFAAGASVLYGLYYAPIRIFRLDQRTPAVKQTLLRLWTGVCVLLYAAHVAYLALWRWDYTYNMAANVAVGIVHNVLWSWFSVRRYRRSKKTWAAWPGLIVAWVVMAMSLELLDFPPVWGMVDAHSPWHLGTVAPTIWWYHFLVKDAQQDLAGERLKA